MSRNSSCHSNCEFSEQFFNEDYLNTQECVIAKMAIGNNSMTEETKNNVEKK
jgi:hypothetical protein